MDPTRYTLIQRLQNQYDEDAWKTFTSIYESFIYKVLIRAGTTHDEAVDLRQDILLKLWKKFPDFTFDPEIAKFRTWLGQVIRNTAYTYFSVTGSKRERLKNFFHMSHVPEAAESDAYEKLVDQEWKSHLTALAFANIEKTTSPQFIMILKRTLEGTSVSELAEELDLKENSIYKARNRTKDKLMKEIARLRKDLE